MTRTIAPRTALLGGAGLVLVRYKLLHSQRNTIVDIGRVPAYSSLLGGSGVHIQTVFNDSGTDTIDIGFRDGSSTDDPDAYATTLAATAIGFIVVDELAATTNIMQTKPAIITARYNGQNSDSTAGVAYISLVFSVGPTDGQ